MSLMKEPKVLESCSKHNLPDELWFDVLSWLPVKSLLRFRCVSKTWQSMVNDPEFCRLHLNRFKNNVDESHLFVAQQKGYESKEKYIVRCSDTFKPTITLDSLDTVRLGNEWYVFCSMDGLVLLKYYTPTLELMLWNPSIRKARALPPSPIVISQGMKNIDLGFGFSSSVSDHKLVRLVKQDESSLHSVAIYTVGTGLWKAIEFQGKGISDWCWYFEYGSRWKTVCFMGCLHFIATNLNTDDEELVSFDLSNEVFGAITEPSAFDTTLNEYILEGVTLVGGGYKLGLVYLSPEGDKGCIWVSELYAVDFRQWAKLFIIITSIPHFEGFDAQYVAPNFLYLGKNCEVLLQWESKRVTSYALRTGKNGKEKTLLRTNRLDMNMVCGYIESLVLLNG